MELIKSILILNILINDGKKIYYLQISLGIEMYLESYQTSQILDDSSLSIRQKIPPLNSVKKLDGIGIIEAPRGLLMHHDSIDQSNSIDQINLFVASEFNIPLINKMITKYAQELFEITGDVNLVKKKVQLIIRAFDHMSSTHVLPINIKISFVKNIYLSLKKNF